MTKELENQLIKRLQERIRPEKIEKYINTGLLTFQEKNDALVVSIDNGPGFYLYDENSINIEKITQICEQLDYALVQHPIYIKPFQKSQIEKFSTGAQKNKHVFNMKDNLNFIVYENFRNGDDYCIGIAHQNDARPAFMSSLTICTVPSLEQGKSYLENHFFTQDVELVNKVDSLSKTIQVKGDHEEIKALLQDNVYHLIADCLVKTSNGGMHIDEIKEFDFKFYGSNITIGVKHGQNGNSRSCVNVSGRTLENIFPVETAKKLNTLIDNYYDEIKTKNSSPLWAIENQYNKIKSIEIEWSEIGNLDAKSFNSLDELQDALKNAYAYSRKVPKLGGGYDKTKIKIVLENKNTDTITITPRIDISYTSTDFNPFTMDIKSYLSKQCGYNSLVKKEAEAGLHVIINLEGANKIDEIAVDKNQQAISSFLNDNTINNTQSPKLS